MDEKQKKILAQVRDLMFRLGIKSLTMDDIAQQLGISKKTLYQVVANKADLVNKVVEASISEAKNGLECIIYEDDNAIEELLKIYRHNCYMFQRINPALIFELNKYFPESWKKLEHYREEFILHHVKENIEKGVKTGLYRTDINIDIVSRLYTSRTLEIFTGNMFPAHEYPVNILLKEMFLYHIRGIASQKGHDYLESISFEL